jgi:pimeloyl-ACP methyl ester carboxylesterase
MGRVLPWFAPDHETDPELDPYVLHAVSGGTGPPAVLIHGVAGSNMIWDSMVPLLEPHFSVIRVDLLGYGRSPKPTVAHTPYRHVAAIRRTLARRGFDPPYVLIGLSMGSNLMLEYALRWPEEVEEIVGIGFPYYPSEAAARVGLRNNAWTNIALRHPALAGVLVPSLWRMGRLVPGVLSRSSSIYTGPMAKDALRARYRSFRSSLVNCMVNYRLDEPLKASGQTRRLFIHGGSDQWAPPEAVRDAIAPFPLSALCIIENAPHNLAVAEPGRTATLILDHIGMRAQPQ